MAGSTAITPIRTGTTQYNQDCMLHPTLLQNPLEGRNAHNWIQTLPALSLGKKPVRQIVDLRQQDRKTCGNSYRGGHIPSCEFKSNESLRSKRDIEIKRNFERWVRQQAEWHSDAHATSHRSISSSITNSIPSPDERTNKAIPLSTVCLPEPFPQRLPRRYEVADPMVIVQLISNTLGRLTFFNDMTCRTRFAVTRFHSNRAPQISACEYLRRLTHRLCLSSPILVMMVIYIRQLCKTHPSFDVSSLTAHRLLLSCALVASKSVSDFAWSNPSFASAGGISAAEMAILELELLKYLEWGVAPHQEQLSECYLDLVLGSNGYFAEHGTSPAGPHTV
ncbi:cyclin-domain-containing protein [Aspergillus pseudotamarii]|uniref:Cyclin-domain-containing protein n=1 Tax=Aspergillus pseudotamarii TaxID=132259 RepID=A0A5N6SXL0_ASPPS|nr:cyclin-domain-containing protein [Aspergillus pseudotamarii]KAE8139352.1 cyclin-domain-containing protein [Aspergillus pseudotamarii]